MYHRGIYAMALRCTNTPQPFIEVQRFLRATKWDLPSAFARCEETIVWRREFGVEEINNDATMVEEESKTGKEIILGWDNQKRPCLYMFPGRQNVSRAQVGCPSGQSTRSQGYARTTPVSELGLGAACKPDVDFACSVDTRAMRQTAAGLSAICEQRLPHAL